MERLDKILSNLGFGSRKEVKALVKAKEVMVDDLLATDSGMQIDPEKAIITVSGERVNYKKYIYIMMNKPAGVVSATFDNYDETVLDILDPELKVFNPFPVGRLDKDTVGLLFLTNDGDLNHKLISPKWHVDKVYYAEINKPLDQEDIEAFKDGIILDDGYKCLSANLEILTSDINGSEAIVTVQEGKFHQVKRMFESLNKKVVYLKRVSFGGIKLDEALEEGSFRELSKEELDVLKNI